MKVYKLTTQNFTTFNLTKWGENVTHKTSGEGELCSNGWLHYYHNPLLAVLLNSIHANIHNPILWEAEAEGLHKDDYGLKGGCTKLTTIKQIPLPVVTKNQYQELCIRLAIDFQNRKLTTLPSEIFWLESAKKWLENDRNTDEYKNSFWEFLSLPYFSLSILHYASFAVVKEEVCYHIANVLNLYLIGHGAWRVHEDKIRLLKIINEVVPLN